MSSQIALLRQKLARLKAKQTTLQSEAKGFVKQMPPLVNPLLLEVEEMEIAQAANLLDHALMHQAELLSIRNKIWELEAELGN